MLGRLRRLIAGVLVGLTACAALVWSSPAGAETWSIGGKMMCCGRDRLLVAMPEISNEDWYQDTAAPEVLWHTNRGWQSYQWGDPVYNDDLRPAPGIGFIGGSHTFPGVVWRSATTHSIVGQWNFFVPKGTVVMVRMWLYDGHTRRWKWQWATSVGSLEGGNTIQCRAGQYDW
jgi:hypothetical protein